jgi:uncharacterized membrane protein
LLESRGSGRYNLRFSIWLLMLVSRLKALLAVVLRTGDRAFLALSALGVGAFAWPAVIGAGLGVGALGITNVEFAHGVMRRRATLQWLHAGLTNVALGILIVVLVTLGLAVIRARGDRERGVGALYQSHLRRFAFLAGLPLVVALSAGIESSHSTLALTFVAIVALLATYSAYHWASDDDTVVRPSRVPWALAFVGAAALGYAIAVSFIAIRNHLSFNTGRSDLGYYMSVFRQSSQGHLLGCSLCGSGTHLTGHFDPILVLLSPLYLLYPFADTMLVLQAVWLASGAIPVFLYTARQTKHRGAAVALALAYLLYPALHGVNFFDFHSVALCIPLFVWLIYFLEGGRTLGYFITLVLLLLVREDMPLALVGVSLYAIFRGKETVRLGWLTLAISAAYFIVAKAFLMGRIDPLNSGTGKGGYAYFYEDLIPAGSATKALLGILVTDPAMVLAKVLTEDKVDYVAKLLVPLLGLPLLARGRILLAYGAALTLLASRPFLYSIHFQYSSPLIPFLFTLTASTLGRIREGELCPRSWSGRRAALALSFGVLVATTITSVKFGGFFQNRTFQGGFRPLVREPSESQLEMDAWLRKTSRSLPRGAKVAASSRVLTHLGSVTSVYLLEDRREAEYVIAGPGQKVGNTTIAQEVARGYLERLTGLRHMSLYRAHWAGAPVPAPAPAAGTPKKTDETPPDTEE